MSQQGLIDINTIIFSDESHIYLHGFINKQNYRMWSTQKPIEAFEKPLHSQKVTIWCGLSSHRVYGPFFFEDETGNARTVNSESYIEMLNAIMADNIDPDIWFQQDGATAHTSIPAIDWLKNRFGDKIISHRTDFPWPARSPDLSPLDYFLWGYLKEKIFSMNHSTIQEMKQNIREILSSIDQDILAAVMRNFEKRINLCIDQSGGHFEHLL